MTDGPVDPRGKKVAKDGHFVQSRSVGHRVKSKVGAKFDDEGEEIDDKRDLWLQWDRYFATEPGTESARHALDLVIDNRNKRGLGR